MTRLTEIYNRLDVIDDLIELQKPNFYHGQVISDQVTTLIGYVEQPGERLSNSITDFIGLVGWWLLHIESHSAGRANH